MLAQVSNMEAHELIWTTGDAHVYLNQKEQVVEQLQREPLPLPKLWLNPEVTSLFDFKSEDIEIQNYQHHPEIKYLVAK
jgi:thymidylate synthase